MTKEKLEAYKPAAMELAMIDEELARFHQVRDSVKGSMLEHPYVLQTIQIAGVDLTVAVMLENRKAKLIKQRREVEEFFAAVGDPYMVALLRARYVKGLSWAEVSMQAGGGNTANGIRMAVERFLCGK